MEIPSNNEDYRNQHYWDVRYMTEDKYDWFSSYPALKHHLKKDIKSNHKILMLGCGNSTLSEEMYKDNFLHITNIDFSPVVIQKMRDKYSMMPEMSWEVMDITKMKFEKCSFDVVIEKGTIDALMVHEKDPWNTSEESLRQIDIILEQNIRKQLQTCGFNLSIDTYCTQHASVTFVGAIRKTGIVHVPDQMPGEIAWIMVTSILKPDGKFISVTFSQPHFRKPLYACSKYNWSVTVSTFGTLFHFFYFVMCKGEALSDKDKQKEIERQGKKLFEKNNPVPKIVTLQDEDGESFLLGIDL